MTLLPLRAAVLAVTAFLAIPWGVAEADSADALAAGSGVVAAGETADSGGGAIQTLSEDTGSQGVVVGTVEPSPSVGVLPTATDPPPPGAEPPAELAQPASQPAVEDPGAGTPTPSTHEAPRPPADPRVGEETAPPNRTSSADESGESAVASSGGAAPPADSLDGGAPDRPAVHAAPTAVDRLLPRLYRRSRPVDGHAAALDRRPERGVRPQGVALTRMDPYTRVDPGAAPASRPHAAAVPTERGGEAPSGTGSRDGGTPDNAPPPSSPAPGSASASPGGGFFAGGLMSLAALLIALALPRLRARLELLPRGRCTVAFLRPLERPG